MRAKLAKLHAALSDDHDYDIAHYHHYHYEPVPLLVGPHHHHDIYHKPSLGHYLDDPWHLSHHSYHSHHGWWSHMTRTETRNCKLKGKQVCYIKMEIKIINPLTQIRDIFEKSELTKKNCQFSIVFNWTLVVIFLLLKSSLSAYSQYFSALCFVEITKITIH